MEKRTSFQIQIAVFKALCLREIKTRFGRYRMGIAWAILEPVFQILFFMGMFYFRGMSMVGGLELPVFLATGIAPYLYFKKVIDQSMGAVAANKNLLIYRQVRVFDTFFTRFILEAGISFIVLVALLFGAWWFGYQVELIDSLHFIGAFVLLSLLAFGLGLVFGVLNSLYPEAGKFIPMLLRPLMFISGTFFSINELPRAMQEVLLWNPLIHVFELMRSCFSYYYDTSLVSMEYLALCALTAMTLGMLMFRANWRKMLTI